MIPSTPRTHRRRPGFTLVELLVVIVIIALLIGLLLPAIAGAVAAARNAAVQGEISQLASALTDFKAKYGDYPPSRFLCCENGYYNTSAAGSLAGTSCTDISYGALAQRSISYLRKFWPRVAVSTSGAVYSGTTFLDFNGNGSLDAPYVLEGHECLVFFLGGIPTSTVTNGQTVWGVSGFSKDPANPFVGASNGAPNRSNPFFDFNSSRLALTSTTATLPHIPGYQDSLKTGAFYAYFSAYGGNNYDANDVNFDPVANASENQAASSLAETDANGTSPITLNFQVNFPVVAKVATNVAVSMPPNPYTSTGTNGLTPTYQSPNSFQILSAGADGAYGLGGFYNPSATIPLVVDSANTNSTDTGVRNSEKDNLTNFRNGRLD